MKDLFLLGSRQKGGFLDQVGEMEKEGKFKDEKFNRKIFKLWKMHMDDYMYQKGLFLTLSRKNNKLKSISTKEWELLNRNMLGIVRLCLRAMVAFNISKEMTTKDFMHTLAKLYEKPSNLNKVFLIKCLFSM